ncbi:MAG: Rieske 2Fe-2S domain-containing protein [Gordonia sp. (in: high G+C Gram-positive bacteria)]
MLKREDNEKITRSGPGTPLGNLLRSYWQPAGLVSEMPDERPVKQVRILGEDLVLFKKPAGWGLISRYCAHRGVDLSYGRLEDDGIRCLYHGWLYDGQGRCIDQPAEPEHSRFLHKIRIASYPCVERNGIIFTYMGAGEPPPLPHYDCFVAPEEYTFAFKGLWECNWLQGLEGGIDPSHVSFLHRFIREDPRDTYGQQFAEEVEGTGKRLSTLVGESYRPDIDVENAEHGLRVYALRRLTEDTTHVRVTNLLFPNAFVVPFGTTKVFTQWHVPIDDTHHYWYMIWYDYAETTDRDTLLRQRLEGVSLPDYRPLRNRSNNWGFDPREQRELTYTGMGLDINVHDQWAVESMGAIQDRTVERLGVSDRAVSANRRLLLRAIDAFAAGATTPSHPVSEAQAERLTGPIAMDTIATSDAWQSQWIAREASRRAASPWAGPLMTTHRAASDA